ncbi:hypothetical protein CYMTET_21570 [Cymbomonas tetramitiformis]|uniref:Uncharacterized protein n=1 Tax=Cymbomonas tetramitiformis TaxID=36881 RepID=A0AAE0G1P8_9CHLO|nr:hypothetical protein CYMTET_21570 [Cymbomonas tetramitiformis]
MFLDLDQTPAQTRRRVCHLHTDVLGCNLVVTPVSNQLSRRPSHLEGSHRRNVQGNTTLYGRARQNVVFMTNALSMVGQGKAREQYWDSTTREFLLTIPS